MTAPEPHDDATSPAEPPPQCHDCINSTARDHEGLAIETWAAVEA